MQVNGNEPVTLTEIYIEYRAAGREATQTCLRVDPHPLLQYFHHSARRRVEAALCRPGRCAFGDPTRDNGELRNRNKGPIQLKALIVNK